MCIFFVYFELVDKKMFYVHAVSTSVFESKASLYFVVNPGGLVSLYCSNVHCMSCSARAGMHSIALMACSTRAGMHSIAVMACSARAGIHYCSDGCTCRYALYCSDGM